MASTKAFNSVVQSFISELANLYGDSEPKIITYAESFPIIAESSPDVPLEMFMSNYGPYTDMISSKDETLFDIVPMLFNTINVKTLWLTTTEENKEAIWKYLQTLSLLGTTIRMIPTDMLSTIENVAFDCAKQFESGKIDPSSLMSVVPKLLGSLSTQR